MNITTIKELDPCSLIKAMIHPMINFLPYIYTCQITSCSLKFKRSVTNLQNIVGGGGGGVLKRKKGNCNTKLQFMVANYESVEFIVIMQHLIDKYTIFF